jgi:2-hydroxychromene-2-carboxylate isomerase
MCKTDSIAFYFDFVSPYAYLASNLIDDLASRHQKRIHWLPFRLGVAVVKVMGLKPLLDTPLKNEYTKHDLFRMAQTLGMPLTDKITMFDPVSAQKLFYGSPQEIRADLAKLLLSARWAEGVDIGDVDVLTELVHKRLNVSEDDVRSWVESSMSRDAVREATNAAIARGVFGSPTFAVGSELFWGVDRMWLLDRYLASGGKYEPSQQMNCDIRRTLSSRVTTTSSHGSQNFLEFDRGLL